jgi:hypothetical protein
MKSKTYVVAWDEVMENCLDIDQQLKSAGLEYVIFDVSNVPVEREGWVVAEKVRYFGHFYNGLKDFVESDADIFIFNAGDVYGSCQAELTKSVEKAMAADPDIWIMGPNITNEKGHGKDPIAYTSFSKSNKYPNYVLTVHICGIWVALSRELATEIYNYYEWAIPLNKMNFEKMISGHGLDSIYAAWTLYNNKKIYRDVSFEVTTGLVPSYDTSGAIFDYIQVGEGFAEFIGLKSGNSSKLKNIYNFIQRRINTKTDTYSLSAGYLNLDNIEEFNY